MGRKPLLKLTWLGFFPKLRWNAKALIQESLLLFIFHQSSIPPLTALKNTVHEQDSSEVKRWALEIIPFQCVPFWLSLEGKTTSSISAEPREEGAVRRSTSGGIGRRAGFWLPSSVFGGTGSGQIPRLILPSWERERFSIPFPFSSVSLLFLWPVGNVFFEESALYLQKFIKPLKRPKVLHFIEVESAVWKL